MTRAEQLTEPHAHHGEGPVWTERWGLRWVDMLAGDVLTLRPGGHVDRNRVGAVAAMLRPRRDGGAVIAVERGFALAGDDLADPRPLPPLWSDPGIRMNEGGCDPAGRVYCGSMAYDKRRGAGALYRMDPDGRVEVAVPGVTVSNGLAFSPDGATAYYVDTGTRRVDAFDWDPDRGLHGRRPLVRVPEGAGAPDGLTVDAEGCLWVALWGGSAVRRYTPAGALDGVVELPVTQVTACAFGGPDRRDLFVTTSREEVAPGSQPVAGAVFRAEVGVRGLPVLPFAG